MSVTSRFPPYVVAVAVYVAAAVLFLPQLEVLAERWGRQAGDSHGWLVLVAVPVLYWMRRQRVHFGRDRPGAIAILAAVALALWLAVATASGIDVLATSVFPLVVLCGVWSVLGARSLSALAGPTLFFFFAIPIWGVFIPLLQRATIVASPAILGLVGVPTLINGSLVTVPAGTFEIAEGCAGEHFFIVGLTISTLIVLVDSLPLAKSLRLIAVAALVAIVTNWIRVSAIIYIGNATAMRSSLVRDHGAFGWWIFAAALVPILLYARRLSAHDAPATATATARAVALARVGDTPTARRIVATLALLAAGPAWVVAVGRLPPGPVPNVTLPAVAGWRGPEEPIADWRPEFPGAAVEVRGRYLKESATADVYAAFYNRQTSRRKLIGYESSVAGTGWDVVSRTSVQTSGQPAARVVEIVLAKRAGSRRLIWTWYEVGGERMSSPWRVKIRQARGAFGRTLPAGVVALSAACESSCDSARLVLADAFRSGLDGFTLRPTVAASSRGNP